MTDIRKSTYEKLGEYSLEKSDSHEGSLLLISDFWEIIGLQDTNSVDKSQIKLYNGKEYIEDKDANKIWRTIRKKIQENEISNIPEYLLKIKQNLLSVSFDELLIRKLLLMTFSECHVEMQIPIKNPETNHYWYIDLRVTNGKESKYIEFMGPTHFIQMHAGCDPENPLKKKEKLENIEKSIEVVIWPYWIARCKKNAEIIFKKQEEGIGALWSTSYLFGMFFFDKSAEIIQKITERFNAWDATSGICKFYQKDSYGRTKPAHPIINDILNGNTPREKLLPKGAYNSDEQWIPNVSKHNP